MRLRVLASGSKGNCVALESEGRIVLIDLGLSCRELVRRMKACALLPDSIAAVLFTHDHFDHCSGLATFHKKFPQVPFYANGNTADAIAASTQVEDGWCVFETAERFELGPLGVSTFSVPHDAADPVGYLIEAGDSRLFLGTDMGVMTLAAKDALRRADCAVLEANHDLGLLHNSDRPLSLKQRIAGRCGHLSNDQMAEALVEVNPPRLRTLLLAHISSQCNAPYLAEEAAARALGELRRTDVAFAALSQDEPSDLYEF